MQPASYRITIRPSAGCSDQRPGVNVQCRLTPAAAPANPLQTHCILIQFISIWSDCKLTVLCQQLGGDAAQSAQHGPASMDDLQLTEPTEGLGVSRQTSSVPTIVTGELASQVGGGVGLRKGSCGESKKKKGKMVSKVNEKDFARGLRWVAGG